MGAIETARAFLAGLWKTAWVRYLVYFGVVAAAVITYATLVDPALWSKLTFQNPNPRIDPGNFENWNDCVLGLADVEGVTAREAAELCSQEHPPEVK
jgi:hypothetical protein